MTCGQLAGSRPRLPSLGGERSGCAGIAPLERRPLGVERCPQSFPGCWAGWPWSRASPAGLHLSQSDRPAAPVWGAAADLGLVRRGPGAGHDLAPAAAGRDGADAGWEQPARASPSRLHAMQLPRPGVQKAPAPTRSSPRPVATVTPPVFPGRSIPERKRRGPRTHQHPETGRLGTKVSRFRPTGSLRQDLACVIFFFFAVGGVKGKDV